MDSSHEQIWESTWPWPALEFSLDPASTALLLVDAQQQTVEGLRAIAAHGNRYGLDRWEQQARGNCARLLTFFRERGMRVVFITSGPEIPSQRDLSEVVRLKNRQWTDALGTPALAQRGTPGHAIVDELAPFSGEAVVNKLTSNAFLSSNLNSILRNLDVKSLVIAGVGTYDGVDSTARGASDLGFQCVLIEDATACEDSFQQRQALRSYLTIFGRVQTTDGILAELAGEDESAKVEGDRVTSELLTPRPVPDEQRERVLPVADLDFGLSPDRTALLVVDMQYFCHPDHGMASAMESVRSGYTNYKRDRILNTAIPNCQRLLARFREQGRPVVFLTIGPELPDCSTPPKPMVGRNRQRERVSGRRVVFPMGSFEHGIMAELAPLPDEPVVNKLTASGFMTSKIDAVLRHLGIDSLVIGGVATNACVESTARDAADSGYRCLLVDDACAGYDAAFHEMTMRSFRNVFGRIGTTDDALRELA